MRKVLASLLFLSLAACSTPKTQEEAKLRCDRTLASIIAARTTLLSLMTIAEAKKDKKMQERVELAQLVLEDWFALAKQFNCQVPPELLAVPTVPTP